MSLHERTGRRDLTYSAWHRPPSIGRFLPPEVARALTYIDVDAVEVCDDCGEPLLLIELARDVGQAHKPTTIMQRLARRADLPAALSFYRVGDDSDIDSFRVRLVEPASTGELVLSPASYECWLRSLRETHRCTR